MEPAEGERRTFLHEVLPIAQVERVLEAVKGAGVTPHVRTLGPKSGIGFSLGVSSFDPLFLESGISVQGSQLHRVGIEIGDPAFGGRISYSFRRDVEDEFWGVGANPGIDEIRSDFLRDKHEVALGAWYEVSPLLLINAGVAYENNHLGSGRDGDLPNIQAVYEDPELLGLGERVEMVRFGLSAATSLLSTSGFRREGVWLRVGTSIFRGVRATEAGFHRFHTQIRGYKPLGSRHMLALRTLLEMNRPGGGSGIPFFDLARMGGGRNGPRGFTGGRFRDRDGLSIMIEWRIEVWRNEAEQKRVQAVLFFDQGGVTRSITGLSGDELRSSYGLGARLMEVENLGLSTFAYAAFSEAGSEFGLKTHWSF